MLEPFDKTISTLCCYNVIINFFIYIFEFIYRDERDATNFGPN